jgi:regulator of replication initiation timing
VSDWDDSDVTPIDPLVEHIRILEANLRMAEATCRELQDERNRWMNERARLLLEIRKLRERK